MQKMCTPDDFVVTLPVLSILVGFLLTLRKSARSYHCRDAIAIPNSPLGQMEPIRRLFTNQTALTSACRLESKHYSAVQYCAQPCYSHF